MANDKTIKNLNIEPGIWGDEIDQLIESTSSHVPASDIRYQVECQGAKLFCIKDEGKIVGAFVLRVDETASGSEGVIVAAAGNVKGIDMVTSCLPAIETLFIGCKLIRYHTSQPALARKMAKLGYKPREIVCFKEINQDELLAA